MEQLTQADLRRMIACLHELYAAEGLDDVARRMVRCLPRLIGSEGTGYNEVNLLRQRMSVVTDDWSGIDSTAFSEAFLRCQHEHPLLQHHLRTGDGAAFKISDFLTRRQFRDTGIYNEVYRRLDCEHQIAVTLPSTPQVVVAMAFNRRKRDFSERDRAVLNLLRPHLAHAYVRAATLQDLHDRCGTLQKTLEALDDGVLVAGSHGKIAWESDRARRWMSAYFPNARAATLPDRVRSWLRSHDLPCRPDTVPSAPKALVIAGDAGELLIRVASHNPAGQSILVLSEHPSNRSSEPLRALGLTAREAEVLLWMTQGKTNPQIAMILSSKPRTIQKHAENIFRKLGVETRTAAGLRAMEVFGGKRLYLPLTGGIGWR